MDDYLTKPLSPNLLAEKVQHWLAVSRSANPRRPSQNVPACEEQGSSRDEQPEIGAKAARMHS
jgi:DNA-binding response OmpR family regulator